MVDTYLLNWTLNHLLAMLVIMLRVIPVVFFMPVIGSKAVPTQVKILFTLITSFALAPMVAVDNTVLPINTFGYLSLVVSEISFGAILAVFARLFFASVEIAGQMVGIQMGMGMAGAMDPEFGVQVSLIGQFWNIIAILIFLSINGHHIFFQTLADSFAWVRPGTIHLSQATFEGMMRGVTYMFVLAIKIMAPAGAAVFFSHVAMGIISKTVPQIPILIVGMPMNIAVGLIFVGLSLTYFLPLMTKNFELLGHLLPKLAVGMGG